MGLGGYRGIPGGRGMVPVPGGMPGGGYRGVPGGGYRGMPGGEGGGRYAGGAPSAPGAQRTSLPKGQDYLLLRFFDFTVEPGKKYKYRVSLVLSDVNYSIPENVLAPEVLDRHRKESEAAQNHVRPDFRRIEGWSDPSPTVGIPLSGNVNLVEVKPSVPEKFNDEPVAKLLVESFDLDEKGNAIQAATDDTLVRGGVANMVGKAEYLGNGPWIDTADKFKYTTGMMLVDIDGGQKLTRDYTSPGRALLMGPAGEPLHPQRAR